MSDSSEYMPPKVWTWEVPDGGIYGSVNRPTAGARHEKTLPVGKHPLQLYSLGTPNGMKVTVMLEELLELGRIKAEYDAWPIEIKDGDQFGSGFVDINPNSKIPALVDRTGPEPLAIFESGSILLYLAEKFDAFLPTELAHRTRVLNWLFWQVGSTPFYGGGFAHFFVYAPVKIEYAINRYTMELKRQLDVLDRQLSKNAFIGGSSYSIADMAIFPWYGGLVLGWAAEGVAEFVSIQEYPAVIEWATRIAERPAVKRGRMVNRTWGEPSMQLHERHGPSDFETR